MLWTATWAEMLLQAAQLNEPPVMQTMMGAPGGWGLPPGLGQAGGGLPGGPGWPGGPRGPGGPGWPGGEAG